MSHRLYHPPPLDAGRTVRLDSDRAHYLTRVLRLRRGEQIVCFDGSGRAWPATLVEATTRSAKLELGEPLAAVPAPEPPIHLALGMLKGAAMDAVMQKATELGATDLWPLRAERSNVPGDPARLTRRHAHWQRIMERAAEQCGALHLPYLHPPRELADFLAEPPPARWILLDPGAPTLPLDLPRSATGLLIGPEGGWSDTERHAAAAAGFQPFGLGDRVLRAETVPLAALSALRHGWEWR